MKKRLLNITEQKSLSFRAIKRVLGHVKRIPCNCLAFRSELLLTMVNNRPSLSLSNLDKKTVNHFTYKDNISNMFKTYLDMIGKFLLSAINLFTKANDIWYLGKNNFNIR